MDNVSVAQGEKYFLRLLLNNAVNPTCFDDLRMVKEKECISYQDACRELGILTDDAAWHNTMEEAIRVHCPDMARQVLAQLLAYCEVQDPLSLLLDHMSSLAEDFRRVRDDTGVSPEVQNAVIRDLEKN
jgi:hypothetical protein